MSIAGAHSSMHFPLQRYVVTAVPLRSRCVVSLNNSLSTRHVFHGIHLTCIPQKTAHASGYPFSTKQYLVQSHISSKTLSFVKSLRTAQSRRKIILLDVMASPSHYLHNPIAPEGFANESNESMPEWSSLSSNEWSSDGTNEWTPEGFSINWFSANRDVIAEGLSKPDERYLEVAAGSLLDSLTEDLCAIDLKSITKLMLQPARRDMPNLLTRR